MSAPKWVYLTAAALACSMVRCSAPTPEPATDPESAEANLIDNRGENKDDWWDALPRAAWRAFEPVEQSQSWFEIYEVLPDVFAIYEPGQFEEVISYLILGEQKALLFDTGLGIGDMRRAVTEITDLEPIVVNSHTHYDHVGGNHQFVDVRATTTDYTQVSSGGRSHEEVAEFVGEGWIWKELPEGFSLDAYESLPFTIAGPVDEGDVFDLGDRRLEVLLTPGHAPDSLCLLDRERGLLFTGDTFYPATLYAHLQGSDFHVYRTTAERLAKLAPDLEALLPAHNEPVVDPEGLVRMLDAFDAIAAGGIDYDESDGTREYAFDGFTILTPDPLPEP